MATEGELSALVRLLEDDSDTVLTAVTNRFNDLGELALPALRDAARSTSPKVRERATPLLYEIERREIFERLVELAKSSHPDLEEGALLLASLHTHDLDHATVRAQLDAMADSVRDVTASAADPEARIRAFLGEFHGTLGFAGDSEDFYAFPNNFIHTVVERRRGIPITLILIYVLLGRRLGLDIDAVGAPYRALAHFEEGEYRTYIDAFAGGELRTRDECAELLRDYGFRTPTYDQYLRLLGHREILARMTQNIINYCDSEGRDEDGSLFRRFSRILIEYRNQDRLVS